MFPELGLISHKTLWGGGLFEGVYSKERAYLRTYSKSKSNTKDGQKTDLITIRSLSQHDPKLSGPK